MHRYQAAIRAPVPSARCSLSEAGLWAPRPSAKEAESLAPGSESLTPALAPLPRPGYTGPMPLSSTWITPTDAARIAGVSIQTIRSWAVKGKIIARIVNSGRQVEEESLRAYMAIADIGQSAVIPGDTDPGRKIQVVISAGNYGKLTLAASINGVSANKMLDIIIDLGITAEYEGLSEPDRRHAAMAIEARKRQQADQLQAFAANPANQAPVQASQVSLFDRPTTLGAPAKAPILELDFED